MSLNIVKANNYYVHLHEPSSGVLGIVCILITAFPYCFSSSMNILAKPDMSPLPRRYPKLTSTISDMCRSQNDKPLNFPQVCLILSR